jgi:hypothetical protein
VDLPQHLVNMFLCAEVEEWPSMGRLEKLTHLSQIEE